MTDIFDHAVRAAIASFADSAPEPADLAPFAPTASVSPTGIVDPPVRAAVAAGPVVGLGMELSWTSAVPTTATPTISLFTAGPIAMAGFELSVTLGEFSLWSRVDFFFRTRRPQLIEITDNDPQWKLSSSTLRVSLGLAWEGL